MQKIETKDGSITFHNDEFDETYHSISGAKEESLKKFILPSIEQNPEICKQTTIKILDVCFGLGYNSAAAIDILKEQFPNIKIKIIALELDQNILNKILEINANFSSYNIIKEAVKNNYNKNNISIKILKGDATLTIKTLKEKFDFIFHDPFSTKKMPLLWSESFFKDEYNLLKKGGILTTYSCAGLVRNNLQHAGFSIHDVEPVGRRAPSTLAIHL